MASEGDLRAPVPIADVTARNAGVVRGGPRAPLRGTPERARGSVRRTSTIDSVRPDGWAGSVHVTARARDLRTDAAGAARLVAQESFTAKLSPDRVLREIVHHDARLRALLGVAVAGGFRARAAEALAGEAERATLLHLLVDDLPGASLVAGYALQRDPAWPAREVAFEQLRPMHDLCAGWAVDGTLFDVVRAERRIAVPATAAVDVTEDQDADAWHERVATSPGSMRRARRLDVVADQARDGSVAFDAHFRDSHHDAAGGEGALHEYVVRGRYAPATRTLLALDAAAPVLPWVECPGALASVPRLVGASVDDLRTRVRTDFTGTSTCTHLNDVLRSLADLPALAAMLATDGRRD